MKYKITRKPPESKEQALSDAVRYLENAKETLAKSPIEHNRYQDTKYVHEGSGIAYIAALKAIDGWLVQKGNWTKENTNSIEGYMKAIKSHPQSKKLNDYLNIVYDDLHLYGYYNGGSGKEAIKEGLSNVQYIIELIEKT